MKGFALSGLFSLWIHLNIGVKIELIPPDSLVNESVLLSVTQISGSVQSFSWYKGENTRSQNEILAYSRRNNPSETPGPQYSSRFTSFPNASLRILNLYTEDQGSYTVQVVTLNVQVRSTVHLLVYQIVTKPVIRSSMLYPIGNQTINLTCDTMNSEKIYWGRSGKTFPSGVTLSSNNRTITFSNINPLDGGLYWCEAENPLSKKNSDIYTLNVYCICGSASELSAGEIAGIIIGTILGLVLLIGGAFLILFFRKHKNPVREEPTEEANRNQGPPMEYYNVQAMTAPNPDNIEPAYMDLHHSSQDTYFHLQN